jgi:hypothetical protein
MSKLVNLYLLAALFIVSSVGFATRLCNAVNDRKHAEMVILIKGGHPLEERNAHNKTPLELAVENDDPVAVQILISMGASITEDTVLAVIADSNLPMLQIFLNAGVIRWWNRELGHRALEQALSVENTSALLMLYKHGACFQDEQHLSDLPPFNPGPGVYSHLPFALLEATIFQAESRVALRGEFFRPLPPARACVLAGNNRMDYMDSIASSVILCGMAIGRFRDKVYKERLPPEVVNQVLSYLTYNDLALIELRVDPAVQPRLYGSSWLSRGAAAIRRFLGFSSVVPPRRRLVIKTKGADRCRHMLENMGGARDVAIVMDKIPENPEFGDGLDALIHADEAAAVAMQAKIEARGFITAAVSEDEIAAAVAAIDAAAVSAEEESASSEAHAASCPWGDGSGGTCTCRGKSGKRR